MQTLSYDEARPLIKNGDIINLYRSGRGIKPMLHGLIHFFTGSNIFHCVIAIWMKSPTGTDRLMCVETNLFGGKRIVPLSIYSRYDMEVIPLPSQYSFASMEERAMQRVGEQYYGFLDLLTIGAREFFGLPTKSIMGEVCSELCANLWIDAGVPLIDTHISPGRLRLDLERMGITPTLKIRKQ
jgi:hypothetical protein